MRRLRNWRPCAASSRRWIRAASSIRARSCRVPDHPAVFAAGIIGYIRSGMGDVTDNAPFASQLARRRMRVAYVLAVVTPAAAVLARSALSLWTGDRPFQILFIIPIIISAYAGGLVPGLLATALGALAMDWFAVP